MSSSIPIIQSLASIQNSHLYCPNIKLSLNNEFYSQFKCQYEFICNPIQISPPSVWFSIEQTKCFHSIRNDIERSRATREGFLTTSNKGNILNKINYQCRDQNIGTIQQTQKCFCIAFTVIKDTYQDFMKLISSELKCCLVRKSNLVDSSHLQISQLDQISRQIYNKYRVFLIFDTKCQPGRVVSFHSCFYPNVHFTIQKLKKKQQKQIATFRGNQLIGQIKNGSLMNTYGFLTLDNKKRLVIIKKDDPQLRQDNIIGVWIFSSYPTTRSKKQFSKDDAIWIALLQFYTNPYIKRKLSVIAKDKGLLCYLNFRKQRNRMDSPQFYLFEPSLKNQPKWSFVTKNEILSETNKSCQIKIQFINSIIVQQKQYSQFSDQTNGYEQANKIKNENINRQNSIKQPHKNQKEAILNNQSALSGSSQSQGKSTIKDQQDQKNKIIKSLLAQLQKYKLKCIQLQTMNKILMQQKMMLYGNPCSIMSPIYPQFSQVQGFSYPLSCSQVNGQNNYSMPNQMIYSQVKPQQIKTQTYQTSSSQQIKSSQSKLSQNAQSQKLSSPKMNDLQKKVVFAFSQSNQQQMTFGTNKNDKYQAAQQKEKSFVKKIHPQATYDQQSKYNDIYNPKSQQNHQNNNNYAKTQFNQKAYEKRKQYKNISFQDSFAQYHSQGQDEGPTFKIGFQKGTEQFISKDLQKPTKANQFESSKKNNKLVQEDQYITDHIKSPQFRKVQSLQQSSDHKQNQRYAETITIAPQLKDLSIQNKKNSNINQKGQTQQNYKKTELSLSPKELRNENEITHFSKPVLGNANRGTDKLSPRKAIFNLQSSDSQKDSPIKADQKQKIRQMANEKAKLNKQAFRQRVSHQDSDKDSDSDDDFTIKKAMERYRDK